jgi:hypothetical protein
MITHYVVVDEISKGMRIHEETFMFCFYRIYFFMYENDLIVRGEWSHAASSSRAFITVRCSRAGILLSDGRQPTVVESHSISMPRNLANVLSQSINSSINAEWKPPQCAIRKSSSTQ